jgi:hypothetical protein
MKKFGLIHAATVFLLSFAVFAGETPGCKLVSDKDLWNPMDTSPLILDGSALDLSYMNHKPAGKYGFIKIDKHGNFYFENKPDETVRFYGANINRTAFYGTSVQNEMIADRMSKMGYNVIRIHAQDFMGSGIYKDITSKISEDDLIESFVQLNPDPLNRMDYLIAKLKEKGIYIVIDVFHLFDFENIGGLGEYAEGQNSKFLLSFFPKAMDVWKHMADLWLNHINPYTGLALKDDPALILVSPWNEQILTRMRFAGDKVNKPVLKEFIVSEFNKRLEERKLSPVTTEQFPDNIMTFHGSYRDHIVAFYFDKTMAAYKEMKHHLVNVIGVKAPIGGFNHIDDPMNGLMRNDGSDLHETHKYYYFPNRLGESGFSYTSSEVLRLSEQVNSDIGRRYIPILALWRLFARPFALTEFQIPFPLPGRNEVGIVMGSLGSFQDWDMLNRFTFGGSVNELTQNIPPGARAEFMIAGDPLAILSEYEATLMFRQNYISKGKPKFVIVRDRTWSKTSTDQNYGIHNLMYVLHMFNISSVYADTGIPMRVFKITDDLQIEDILNGNIPDKNEIIIEDHMNSEEVARLFINTLDDAELKSKMLKYLNANTLISDSEEIILDLNTNRYIVNSPYAVAVLGNLDNNKISLRNASITADIEKGSFSAISLDGNKLNESRRILITYLTDVRATGDSCEKVESNGMTTRKYFKGELPALAMLGRANFGLNTNLDSGRYKAFKITMTGERIKEVPVVIEDNELVVSIDTGHGFTYELIYE